MSLLAGIVGLPNVGKSTLFNALTNKSVPAENFPFCTIDPSVGVTVVPDERLSRLSDFSNSKKTIPAIVQFVDIAGLVKGAADGEGLGNQFLSHIREVDLLVEVVRIFEESEIQHVTGRVDPVGDITTIETELILKDLESISMRQLRVEKDARRGDKSAIFEKSTLEKLKEKLESGKSVRDIDLHSNEINIINNLHLLTHKPILYALNKKSGGINLDDIKDTRFLNVIEYIKSKHGAHVIIDAKIEQELSELDGGDKKDWRGEFGYLDDGVNDLITQTYKLLGLITFLTTGEDETRAWTISSGAKAPEAGGAIHTDFKEKFIRAEVISFQDLLDAGSFGAAREKGLVRTEGKEYIVRDGDVIEFKI